VIAPPEPDPDPGEKEGEREDLTHGEPAEGDESQLGVRFAKDLGGGSGKGVEDEKEGEFFSARPCAFSQGPKYGKKHHSFEGGLIELGGVPWDKTSQRKDHGPWDIGRTPVQFPVDEISDPAQPKPHRGSESETVRPEPEILPVDPAEDGPCEHRPCHAPMEGHAAGPCGEYLCGVVDVISPTVKDDVPEASSHDYTHDQPHDEGVERGVQGRGPSRVHLPELLAHEEAGGEEPEEIHEAVPPEGDGSDTKDDRIYFGVGQHGHVSEAGIGDLVDKVFSGMVSPRKMNTVSRTIARELG